MGRRDTFNDGVGEVDPTPPPPPAPRRDTPAAAGVRAANARAAAKGYNGKTDSLMLGGLAGLVFHNLSQRRKARRAQKNQ